MVNANGPQELFVYALTRNGRVETTNYRTVKLPSDMDLPVYREDRASSRSSTRRCSARRCARGRRARVFLEYAWDMGWCDPCAADPLTSDELRSLGVFWQDGGARQPAAERVLTRLHVRYDNAHFPEDLVSRNADARIPGALRAAAPWTGTATCDAAAAYRRRSGSGSRRRRSGSRR